MQLREAEALGMLNNHDAGVGYIDAHFDDSSRYENVILAIAKGEQHSLFIGGVHAAMEQGHPQIGKDFGLQMLVFGHGGAQIDLFGIFNQRQNHIGLATLGNLPPHQVINLGALPGGMHSGMNRLPSRWQLINLADIEIAMNCEREGARNGRGCHG